MLRSFANFLFRHRSYTPIPLILILAVVSRREPVWFLVGVGVALVGETIRIWALRHAGPKTRSHRKIRVDDLVVTGPYSIVRNPLYVGNLFLSLGVCLASGRPSLIVILGIVFVLQYAFIVRAEEDFLEGELGDAYREYKARVPRALPTFRDYRPGDHRFPFREILPRELNTITATETVLVLAGMRFLSENIPVLDLPIPF
jgi:protein-S-isoprenylcysteine O-methyltransferase Ste14